MPAARIHETDSTSKSATGDIVDRWASCSASMPAMPQSTRPNRPSASASTQEPITTISRCTRSGWPSRPMAPGRAEATDVLSR
jgi:hypothetical protein